MCTMFVYICMYETRQRQYVKSDIEVVLGYVRNARCKQLGICLLPNIASLFMTKIISTEGKKSCKKQNSLL